MYCSNCGENIPDGAAFCPVCGGKTGAAARGMAEADKGSGGQAAKTAAAAAEQASELAGKAKEKAAGFGGWYAYNWNRLFKEQWSGEPLKHHLIWGGAHLAVVVVIAALLLSGRGDSTSASYVAYDDSATRDSSSDYGSSDSTYQSGSSYSYDSSEVDEFMDEASELADEIKDEAVYQVQVLFSSLYGKWQNDSGTFTMEIGKDGTVRIMDPTGTFGAEVFTYTEVDNNTVRLKVDSDNALADLITIDMDYSVRGETLEISALSMSYELTRVR